jgi:hypothetical protein
VTSKTRAVAAVAATTVLGVTALVAPSQALAAPSPKVEVRSAHISRDTLIKSARKGNQVAKSTKGAAKVQQYLDQESRQGRLLDEGDVSVAEVPVPEIPGASLTIAWTGGWVPAGLSVQQATDGQGGIAQGIGVETNPAEQTGTPSAPAAVGAGFEGAKDPKNMYTKDAWTDCATVWFKANTTDHQLITCYEKWAQRGTSHWVYNRWGYWTRSDDAGNYKTTEFTIRSRPWAGKEGDVHKLNKYVPTNPSNTCTDRGNLTLGGTFSGVTGQVGIPVRTCSNTILKSDPAKKMIGIGIEGTEPGRQIRLDIAGDYTAKNNVVVPQFADYSWATVTRNWLIDYDYLNKDSGW